MLSVQVSQTSSVDIEMELEAGQHFAADLSAARSAVVSTIRDVNQADRLRGVDKDGKGLTALAPSTLKKRDGSPTPFVEHGTASRVIRNLVVGVEFDRNKMEVKVSWPGCEWLRFHADGAGRLPVRDILGIRRETIGLLDAIVTERTDQQFADTVQQAGRGQGAGGRGGSRSFLGGIRGFFGGGR